jgi:glycosyltransferase involved in cell wall biosynthesis
MSAPREVVNFRSYLDNPYQTMLLTGQEARYVPVRGTVRDALARQAADPGARQLLHVHWEEAVVRSAPTAAEAMVAARAFEAGLARLREAGGRIVWTVHNLAPHEGEHPEAFETVRAAICRHADRVLVHSVATIGHLTARHEIDASRFFLLPHPSYSGVYAPPGEAAPAAAGAGPGRLLMFGQVRRYKGVERFVERFAGSGLAEAGHVLEIRGKAQDPAYAAELAARAEGVPGVELTLGYVPDDAVAATFAGAAALVLPYERFLTSGALMLAMTFGVPAVAPDVPQLREVLPAEAHPFLYPEAEPEAALARARALLALDPAAREALGAALLARAAHYAPGRVAALLADLYDTLLEA